ncbi:hypothetical protein [Streptomyces sp. WELS2]|uniref:hypothetical protein n=1 Tax=Streptomyces sp. WELS2 TaxID=2749435 RepID=UPI0015F0F985|nr:hypothetical protein [Streptomyces sp. WELS2]
MIVLIAAATAVLVVKVLASTPARIAAALGAVALLFGVLPRLFAPLTPPSAPAPAATVTVGPHRVGDSSWSPAAYPSAAQPAVLPSRGVS